MPPNSRKGRLTVNIVDITNNQRVQIMESIKDINRAIQEQVSCGKSFDELMKELQND